ncbi:MAG: DUF11 domain-containing protein [Victivallales bacterium]|nr:DUF11 domain-containing protein [Victivallales bacterium]
MSNWRKTVGLAFLATGMLVVLGLEATEKKGYSWKGYPETAKKPSETTLLIERTVPETVRPNAEYSYELRLTNRSLYKLDEIILTEKIPPNFTVTKITPEPQDKRGNVLKWVFPFMAPSQKEIITISGKATQTGKVVHLGNADLNFHLGQMNAIMEVVNPSLQFTIDAPAEVIVNEVFPATFSFRNNGTATVLEASLNHTLDGLRVAKGGSDKLPITIGDLSPGDSRQYIVEFSAPKTGAFTNKFVAKAKDGVTAECQMKTLVKQPKLVLAGDAPKMRYVGNIINYTLSIKNTGDGFAKDLTAQINLPSGVKFDSADEGGKSVGNGVVWNLGNLGPGETKALKANFMAQQIMVVKATAQAKALAAQSNSLSFDTDVQGIPALLLMVEDVNDPVEVGKNEIYKVMVKNQGSLAATGVKIQCKLEDSMKFINASGPTKAIGTQGGVIDFEPLKSLGVNESVTWIINVEALKEGDMRFYAEIHCDQLQRKVSEDESTQFYK